MFGESLVRSRSSSYSSCSVVQQTNPFLSRALIPHSLSHAPVSQGAIWRDGLQYSRSILRRSALKQGGGGLSFVLFAEMYSAVIILVHSLLVLLAQSSFLVGRGIGDITGPAVEVNFMGYAVPSQRGSGIHIRLRSRAFIFMEGEGEGEGRRVCFVSVDGGMGSDIVNMRVLDRLQEKYGPDLYNQVVLYYPYYSFSALLTHYFLVSHTLIRLGYCVSYFAGQSGHLGYTYTFRACWFLTVCSVSGETLPTVGFDRKYLLLSQSYTHSID